MNLRDLRKWHRKLAPILFLPLFLTAFTGVGYRVGKTWFGASKDFGSWMMYLHQGTFLGPQLRVFYVLLNALGIFVMIFTGMAMSGLFRKQAKQ